MISIEHNHFLNTFAGLLVTSGKNRKNCLKKFSHNSQAKTSRSGLVDLLAVVMHIKASPAKCGILLLINKQGVITNLGYNL